MKLCRFNSYTSDKIAVILKTRYHPSIKALWKFEVKFKVVPRRLSLNDFVLQFQSQQWQLGKDYIDVWNGLFLTCSDIWNGPRSWPSLPGSLTSKKYQFNLIAKTNTGIQFLNFLAVFRIQIRIHPESKLFDPKYLDPPLFHTKLRNIFLKCINYTRNTWKIK